MIACRRKIDRFVQVVSEFNALIKPNFSSKVGLEKSQINYDRQIELLTIRDQLFI